MIDFLQLDIEARDAAYFEFRAVCTSGLNAGQVFDPYLTFTRQVVKKTKYLKQCQTYRIALLPDNASPEGQAIAELEPGKTVVVRALVYDQNGQSVPGIDVEPTSTVIAHSGGHRHDDGVRHNQHMGKLSCASTECTTVPSGKVLNGKTNGLRFTFTAPAPAGDHRITASCTNSGITCTQEGPDRIWVGVKGLRDILDGPYTLTGRDGNSVGWTPTHRSNHYLIPDAAAKLRELGYWYSTVAFPFNARLQINDASLERGGIFDIRNNWKRPHREHCRGTVVDIRANGRGGALNIKDDNDPMIDEIKGLASGRGIDAAWEVPKDDDGNRLWSERHFHVRLLGQEGLQCPW